MSKLDRRLFQFNGSFNPKNWYVRTVNYTYQVVHTPFLNLLPKIIINTIFWCCILSITYKFLTCVN